jgi:hypothetical protein
VSTVSSFDRLRILLLYQSDSQEQHITFSILVPVKKLSDCNAVNLHTGVEWGGGAHTVHIPQKYVICIGSYLNKRNLKTECLCHLKIQGFD